MVSGIRCVRRPTIVVWDRIAAARLLTRYVPMCMGNENNRMRPKMTFNIYNMFRFKLFSGVFMTVSWFLTFQRLPATLCIVGIMYIIYHMQSKSPSKTRFRVSKLSVYVSKCYLLLLLYLWYILVLKSGAGRGCSNCRNSKRI